MSPEKVYCTPHTQKQDFGFNPLGLFFLTDTLSNQININNENKIFFLTTTRVSGNIGQQNF